uniref:Uncharacterized protein n=1 Tax=Gopherus evgoodei TaxID=1825980 RepID=A0A8C4YIF0_9SAUR
PWPAGPCALTVWGSPRLGRCPGGELRSPAAVAMETPTARFSLGARPAGGFSSAPAFPHPAQRAPRVRDHPRPSPGTAREGAERESPPQRRGDSNPPLNALNRSALQQGERGGASQ